MSQGGLLKESTQQRAVSSHSCQTCGTNISANEGPCQCAALSVSISALNARDELKIATTRVPRSSLNFSDEYLKLRSKLRSLQHASSRDSFPSASIDSGILGASLSCMRSLTFQPVSDEWRKTSLASSRPIAKDEASKPSITADGSQPNGVSEKEDTSKSVGSLPAEVDYAGFVQLDDDCDDFSQATQLTHARQTPDFDGHNLCIIGVEAADAPPPTSTHPLRVVESSKAAKHMSTLRPLLPKRPITLEPAIRSSPAVVNDVSPIPVASSAFDSVELSSLQLMDTPPADISQSVEVVSVGSDDDDVICSACTSKDSSPEDPIIFCDGHCNTAVHIQCYGLDDVPPSRFFCEGCSAQDVVVKCILCLKSGGLFRKSECGQWVHPVCVLFTGELTVGERSMRANNLSSLKRERQNIVCFVCRGRGGVQCAHELCLCAFHPYCALTSRVQMVIRSEIKTEIMHYDMFCEQHRSKVDLLRYDLITSTIDIHQAFPLLNQNSEVGKSSTPIVRRRKLTR